MNEKLIFEFLDELRRSGQVNMFGACPHLMIAFNLPPRRAREVLIQWMKQFEEKETVRA